MNDAELLVVLTESSAESARVFAKRLAEAQTTHDVASVTQLVAVAEPLTAENITLRQWHTYARGYLALVARQRPQEASTLLETLRAEQQSLPATLAIRVLNGLGIIYETNEQWDRAAECHQDAISRCEAENDTLGLAKALSNLAIVAYKGLEYTTAIAHLKRSIALFSEQPEARAWQIPLGRAWNELGLAHLQLGELAEACHAFETYLAISSHWDYTKGQGIACINLAQAYQKLNDTGLANEYFARARQLLAQVEDTFNLAEAVYGLGTAAMMDEDAHDRAAPLFDEALKLAQETNNHDIITQIFLSRAELCEKRRDFRGALRENRQAVESVESLRANIAVSESRIRLQGARIEAYEAMVARLLRADNIAEAFRYVEMAKARVMVEMLTGHVIKPAGDIPAEWLAQMQSLRSALDELYQSPPDAAGTPIRIAELEARLNDLRVRIRLRHPEFGSLETVSPLTLPEVQSRLPADTLLLEYFIAAETIYVFWITRTTARVKTLPITLSQLRRAFEITTDGRLGTLRRLTAPPGAKLQSPWVLEKLAESLLIPLGERVWDYSAIGIIPHGILHYVPFHALYQTTADGTSKYLNGTADRPRSVMYAPSATVWLDYCQQKVMSPHKTCLTVGVNGTQLTRAEAEAVAISRRMDGRALTGAAATRAAVLAAAPGAQIIHFSCHGWFNPTWPLSSGLQLADGMLDVMDVLDGLTLQAELVSLSACETGRSRVLRGDELVGLTRAFLYAGTPAVLAGYWLVDELSTQLLMERFYQNLNHQTPAQALSSAQIWLRNLTLAEVRKLAASGEDDARLEAQLDYLANRTGGAGDERQRIFAHPYYWAAFFLVGGRLTAQPA